jgi:hypothetical protein
METPSACDSTTSTIGVCLLTERSTYHEDSMANPRRTIAQETQRIRERYMEILRGLGVENLSPSEERARVDRLEDAIAQVFLFAAQLEMAAVLDVYADWQRMIDIFPDDVGDER